MVCPYWIFTESNKDSSFSFSPPDSWASQLYLLSPSTVLFAVDSPPPPLVNSYVKIRTPSVMVLGEGTGHKSTALANGISVITRSLQRGPCPFSHVGTQREDGYL